MRTPLALLTTTGALLLTAAPAQAIIDGTPTDVGVLPWTVALVGPGEDAHAAQFCTATLIAPDAVLTAAHCVQRTRPSGVTVVVSRNRLSDEQAGERVGVRSIHRTASARRTLDPDLAVLKLTRPVGATPIALAPSDDRPLLRPGIRALAAGWGLTRDGARDTSDILRSGLSTVRASSTCRRAYGSGFRARTMFCAGGEQSHCNGDSGGPVIVDGPTGATLVGVVSFGGDRCSDRAFPAVSARVSALRDWIDRVLAAG